jgi:hypothetical protein
MNQKMIHGWGIGQSRLRSGAMSLVTILKSAACMTISPGPDEMPLQSSYVKIPDCWTACCPGEHQCALATLLVKKCLEALVTE